MKLQQGFHTWVQCGIDETHEPDWVPSTLLSQPVGDQQLGFLLDLGREIPEAPRDEADAPLDAGKGGGRGRREKRNRHAGHKAVMR